MNLRSFGTSIFLLSLSILLLLWMAIFNGAPIFYTDSAAYLWSGIKHEVPVDRPILFSLLINVFSFGVSLWFFLALQCAMGLYLLWHTVKLFITKINVSLVVFILSAYLAIFTSIAYYSGQLMPDFFCSLSLLCFALLICTSYQKYHTVILILIFLLISGTHLSTLLSLFMVSLIILLIQLVFFLVKKKHYFKKSQVIGSVLLIVFSLLFVSSLNYKYNGEFKPSRAFHIFMMARLDESGILKLYLDDYCEKEPNSLCSRINSLPQYGWQFLWTDTILVNGPCMSQGWGYCWLEKKKEFDKIISTVFCSPKYFIPYFKSVFKDFCKQLPDIENQDLYPQKGFAEEAINKKYPADSTGYRTSLQYEGLFVPSSLDAIAVPFTKICCILIIILLVFASFFYSSIITKNSIKPELHKFTLVITLSFFANAWICVFFSNELNRYQGRIAWLMPLLVFLWIGNILIKNK